MLTIKDVNAMGLPEIIRYAVPVMLFFVLIEYLLSRKRKINLYEKKDFLASVGVGIGNLISSALLKFFVFGVILFFYNISPLRIPITWWSYVLCLIFLDFCRYWGHRFGHEQRFWWATHVTHHSSEEFNFATSFRLSWIQQLKVIFFIPVGLAGFHPWVFFICHQIEVLYQFWVHTQLIGKLPWLMEYVFVTPSHHRVHHGKNPKYIDKNYGSTLIIWDRIFGTFQEEEETPVFGITRPLNSYNPITIVFHEFGAMIRDLKKQRSMRGYLKILFGRPH